MSSLHHYKETKEYKNIPKKECRKCHHKGRDIKDKLCGNCRREYKAKHPY